MHLQYPDMRNLPRAARHDAGSGGDTFAKKPPSASDRWRLPKEAVQTTCRQPSSASRPPLSSFKVTPSASSVRPCTATRSATLQPPLQRARSLSATSGMPCLSTACGPGKSPSRAPGSHSPPNSSDAGAPSQSSMPRSSRSSQADQPSPARRNSAAMSTCAPPPSRSTTAARTLRRRRQDSNSSGLGWKFVESLGSGPAVQMLPAEQSWTSASSRIPSSKNGLPSMPWIHPAPTSTR
mmetsp:Transcript_53743/g.136370  ORF Transcript_53743/g.136370 Transcript_53743/m.136370 type:complete len:237 (+) Transcript_53743:518-1228(+)